MTTTRICCPQAALVAPCTGSVGSHSEWINFRGEGHQFTVGRQPGNRAMCVCGPGRRQPEPRFPEGCVSDQSRNGHVMDPAEGRMPNTAHKGERPSRPPET